MIHVSSRRAPCMTPCTMPYAIQLNSGTIQHSEATTHEQTRDSLVESGALCLACSGRALYEDERSAIQASGECFVLGGIVVRIQVIKQATGHLQMLC